MNKNYHHYTPREVATIRRGIRKDRRRKAIAEKIKRTPASVYMLTHRLQWDEETLRSKRRPYTEKELELISRWRRDGESHKKIAKALGRTHGAIRQIACRVSD